MNWIKTLWTKLVDKTSTAPTLVEVEEVEEVNTEVVADIFTQICVDAGIAKKWVVRYEMSSIFAQWYDGPADVDSIRQCIPQFKKEHPELASNLVRIK
tara:strand:+ start:249 stop:542 length:294 start_codon:yes stop_codon:yes gene_type:complete